MRKLFAFLISGARLSASLVVLSSPVAVAENSLTTCTNLITQKMIILKANQERCKLPLAPAFWHIQQSDGPAHTGTGYVNLHTCTSKRAEFDYQLIKIKCAKYQVTNNYWRSDALPVKPVITQTSSFSHESAFLTLAPESAANKDAPIIYYTITSSKGDVKRVKSWRELTITVNGLRSSTSYTFTITATSVDGTSQDSDSSLSVTTQIYVSPTVATQAGG